MASMESYSKAAMERAMKAQDVMLQAMAKKITWWHTCGADILTYYGQVAVAVAEVAVSQSDES